MAVRSYSASVGVALSPGGFSATYVSGAAPTTTTTAVAIAAAAANGTIAGDGTALGLVNAITTALATDKANSASLAGDATLTINTSTISTQAKLKAVLGSIFKAAIENGLAA